jgi:nitrous oxidase accessory protein
MKPSLLVMGVLRLLVLLFAATGPGAAAAPAHTLQERIDRATPGDTLTIDGGTYRENVVIDKPLILEGRNDPVIDGGGQGDVVTITADDVTLSRFVIRNSGRAVSQEPAAIKVMEAHAPTIKHNRIESSHFGIHITDAHHAVIDGNSIDVGGVPVERRGHALYLWKVFESAVHDNTISNAADGIHLEFSDDNGIGLNTVTGSRYALHFMYANNNRILNNTFVDNLSGAVLMFSRDLLLKDNELSGNRRGATGAGILAKDVDNLFVEGNRILRNKFGLTASSTPQTKGATATFLNNLFALNDTGVGLTSDSPITFVQNAMIDNTEQVESLGGDLLGALAASHPGSLQPATGAAPGSAHEGHGAAKAPAARRTAAGDGPVWSIGGGGNYWSDYAGYDADGDGVGDQPYRPRPAFAGALADNPTLRLFRFTLAQEAIDLAAEMFPVYRYDPVIEDGSPLMSAPGPALPDESGTNGGLLLISVLLLALAAGVVQVASGTDPIDVIVSGGKRAARYVTGGAR